MDKITVGPFRFTFLPDGDDQDTGLVLLETTSGYPARTDPGVSRDEWDDFTASVTAACFA